MAKYKSICFRVESATLWFEKRWFLTTFCSTAMAKAGAFAYAKKYVDLWDGNHKPIKVIKVVDGLDVMEWVF